MSSRSTRRCGEMTPTGPCDRLIAPGNADCGANHALPSRATDSQLRDLRHQARNDLQSDILVVHGGHETISSGELLALSSQIEALGGTVYADGESEVSASGDAAVFGQGATKVTGGDNTIVSLQETASGEINGNAKATVMGTAQLVARGDTEAYAGDNTVVELFDSSQGVGHGNARFVLHDRAVLYAKDNVTAEAHDQSHMVLSGSAKGVAYDEATWEIHENAAVIAGEEIEPAEQVG